MATAHLTMVLEGPLQSWGHSSRYGYRGTAPHPTRSGLTGIICAAMGLDRGSDDEAEWLVKINAMRLTCYEVKKNTSYKAGRLVDFHTISGPICANGKISRDNSITYREYIVDGKFVAVFEGGKEDLVRIGAALADPVWGIWLGRKCCIPSSRVFRGVAEDHDGAIKLAGLKDEKEQLRSIVETESFDEGGCTIRDVPLNFDTRCYAPRRIRTDIVR